MLYFDYVLLQVVGEPGQQGMLQCAFTCNLEAASMIKKKLMEPESLKMRLSVSVLLLRVSLPPFCYALQNLGREYRFLNVFKRGFEFK